MFGFDIGSVIGAGVSAWQADRAQQKQIEWERERAKNAHQWEVQDLKAAGLNPILSAGGPGATTGGISAPQMDVSGINSAFLNKAQEDLLDEEKKQKKAETKNKITQNKLLQQELKIATANAKIEQANAAATIPKLNNRETYNKSTTGKILNYINFGAEDLGGPLIGALGFGAGGALKSGITSAGKLAAAKQAKKAAVKAQSEAFKSIIMDTGNKVALPKITIP